MSRAPRTRLATVVGLILAMASLGLASTVFGRSGEPPPDRRTEEAAEGEATAGAQVQTTLSFTTTTAAPPTTAGAGRLVLGERSNLWLFYGGADQLQRLDLDSGVLDVYGLRAGPLAVSGGELIVVSGGAATGSIAWISLDDPGEQAQGWQRARLARANDPGRLWLLTDGPPIWTLVDLASNQVVQRIELPSQAVDQSQTGSGRELLVPGPDLITTATGVYRREDGSYRRVESGRLLEYRDTHALVENCGSNLDDCWLTWFDRATWRPLPLPVPDHPVAAAELLGGGRWLLTTTVAATPSFELLSLESRQPFALVGPVEAVAISPDGRWLAATLASDTITVIDLDSGEAVASISVFDQTRGGRVLFVEQSDEGPPGGLSVTARRAGLGA